MKSQKIRYIVIISVFALLIGIFCGALILQTPKASSDWERRPLAQFPEFSYERLMSGEFMREFETYLVDQFPLRNQLRTLKATIHYNLFLAMDNNDIFVTDGHASKLSSELSVGNVEHFTKSMTKLYKLYLKENDCKVYYAIVPDKNRFLTEDGKYPGYDYSELYAMVDKELSYMEKIEIDSLLSIEDYYTTDTHWKQENITDVADKILTSMGMKPTGEFTQEVMGDFYGVYYGQSALPLPADKITVLKNSATESSTVKITDTDSKGFLVTKTPAVYEKAYFENSDPYDIYLGGAAPIVEITNPEGEKGKELVIFRDSFGSSIAPLLLADYSKVTLVDTRYLTPEYVGAFVKFTNQDVLFIYSTLLINQSIGAIK